jgi:aminodeoxyfutalosine deaminase
MVPFSNIPADQPWTLTARWIIPVDGPPRERGQLTIQGERIVGLTPAGTAAVDVDLGDAVVIPGLVNAHTHLDLTGLRDLAPPSPDFTAWLWQVIDFRRGRSAEAVRRDIQAGVAECVRFGTTLVGDISGDGGSWDILADAPLRAVVYREFLGLPADRASGAWERLDNWLASRNPTPTCWPGVSPHAPYSVRSSLFLAASTRGWPVATHLAESPEELELLNHRSGGFVGFLKQVGVWAPDGLAESIEHVLHLLNGVEPTLVVHGNYLRPEAFFPANASLVYCPRTHAAFGHPPHPFRDFFRRGVRVALGTDSLASNPDLDLLAEARFLHARFPDVGGDVILRMATLDGAAALGQADATGSLTPGKSADFAVVPMDSVRAEDPYHAVLGSHQPVCSVFFRGKPVFTSDALA